MDDRAVAPAPQALAEFERVAPVTLLRRPVGLEAHLVRIDHLRREPERRKLTRHEERDRACFQGDARAGREAVRCAQVRKPRGRRGDLALGGHPPRTVLDHERALPAVDVQANVVLLHRAAILLHWGSVRMTPWSAADRIAAEGGPSSLIQLWRLMRAMPPVLGSDHNFP